MDRGIALEKNGVAFALQINSLELSDWGSKTKVVDGQKISGKKIVCESLRGNCIEVFIPLFLSHLFFTGHLLFFIMTRAFHAGLYSNTIRILITDRVATFPFGNFVRHRAVCHL